MLTGVRPSETMAANMMVKIPVREQDQYRFGCVLSDTTDKYSDPFFVDILVAMENACKSRNATNHASRASRA